MPNTEEIFLRNGDALDCRIIKIGKESSKIWKNKDGTTTETNHMQIILHVYSISNGMFCYSYGKRALINPQVKWLGEVKKFVHSWGDEVFNKRITIHRNDEGRCGKLEVTNVQPDCE